MMLDLFGRRSVGLRLDGYRLHTTEIGKTPRVVNSRSLPFLFVNHWTIKAILLSLRKIIKDAHMYYLPSHQS